MGIRGIDIQVAIQRAAEAQKIQQGEISQARAGEAGSREATEELRVRQQEQPQKTERQDEVIIRQQREKERRDRDEKKDSEESSEESDEEQRKKPRVTGKLDITA